jgi:aldehyde dehydrogenase (NAD+)
MSTLNPEQRLFIDDALVGAEGGQTYNVINPATEEVAGIATAASLADADRALAAARRHGAVGQRRAARSRALLYRQRQS